jgi:uncharacterized membrane protein YkoI
MKLSTKIALSTASVVAGLAAALTALFAHAAGGVQENDAAAIAKAGLSLGQAVAIAEQHVGGKATRAEFEQAKGGTWLFDVEVVNDTKVFDVKVDAAQGTVLASKEDTADNDDDHDEKD